MDNVDHICELIQLRWGIFSLLVTLCITLGIILRYHRQRVVKVAVALVVPIFFLFFLRGMMIDYNIILLDGEEDQTAERAFNYLNRHLTDKHMEQLLLKQGDNNLYLHKPNVRFYLALMAIKRGLRIDPGPIEQPRFFGQNGINALATAQRFPATYEELLRKYRASQPSSER